MRVYHWVAILAGGAILTASAAAVLGSQNPAKTEVARNAPVRSGASPSPIRESQNRQQAPASSAPQRVETIKYGSWVVVCEDSLGGTAKKTCSASLRAMNQRGDEVLVNWVIGVDKDGHFVTAIHVPPGMSIKKDTGTVGGALMIQNGLELKFGNGPARRISFLWCGPKQCLAEALIDDAFVKEATANPKATITIHTTGGPIPIELPINGMDKAIASTRK